MSKVDKSCTDWNSFVSAIEILNALTKAILL
jgi:hypothetical protein